MFKIKKRVEFIVYYIKKIYQENENAFNLFKKIKIFYLENEIFLQKFIIIDLIIDFINIYKSIRTQYVILKSHKNTDLCLWILISLFYLLLLFLICWFNINKLQDLLSYYLIYYLLINIFISLILTLFIFYCYLLDIKYQINFAEFKSLLNGVDKWWNIPLTIFFLFIKQENQEFVEDYITIPISNFFGIIVGLLTLPFYFGLITGYNLNKLIYNRAPVNKKNINFSIISISMLFVILLILNIFLKFTLKKIFVSFILIKIILKLIYYILDTPYGLIIYSGILSRLSSFLYSRSNILIFCKINIFKKKVTFNPSPWEVFKKLAESEKQLYKIICKIHGSRHKFVVWNELKCKDGTFISGEFSSWNHHNWPSHPWRSNPPTAHWFTPRIENFDPNVTDVQNIFVRAFDMNLSKNLYTIKYVDTEFKDYYTCPSNMFRILAHSPEILDGYIKVQLAIPDNSLDGLRFEIIPKELDYKFSPDVFREIQAYLFVYDPENCHYKNKEEIKEYVNSLSFKNKFNSNIIDSFKKKKSDED